MIGSKALIVVSPSMIVKYWGAPEVLQTNAVSRIEFSEISVAHAVPLRVASASLFGLWRFGTTPSISNGTREAKPMADTTDSTDNDLNSTTRRQLVALSCFSMSNISTKQAP